MDEEDIQIGDVDKYTSGSKLVYSHQGLVMQSKKRILELGGHELSAGINEVHQDPINKTTKIIYKEDTRIAFVNAVKMCRLVMNCDFDKDAKENIEYLESLLENKKSELLKNQINWWNSLSAKGKTDSKLIQVPKTILDKRIIFYEEYLSMELEVYMELFQELNNLASRLGFYEQEDFEA